MPIDEYSGSDEVDLEPPLIKGVLVTNSNTLAKFKIQLPNGGRDFLLVKTRDLPEFQIRSSRTVFIFRTKSAKVETSCTRADGDTKTVFMLQVQVTNDSSGGSGVSTNENNPNLSRMANQLNNDLKQKSAAMAVFYKTGKGKPYVAEADEDKTITVLISKPEKNEIVIRQLRGVNVGGTTTNASNVELSWSGTEAGSQSTSSKSDGWQDVAPLAPGKYKLTATVCDAKEHSVNFTVILAPAMSGYTSEDIQLLNTFRWGDNNTTPEAQLIQKLAREAGLVDKGDDFSDNITGKNVADKVKIFAKAANGNFNLYYSASGDKSYIEKKVKHVFGTHLSDTAKTKLIADFEAMNKAGFIDATDAFHDALKNTLDIFFAKSSVGRMIAEIDIPLFVNPALMLLMDGAKKAVSMKFNYELSQDKNGAPFFLRNKSKIELFDAVGVEVVGAIAGGVVVKAGSGAFKVLKSFFKKYEFKFRKKLETIIDPKALAKFNDPARKPKVVTGRVAKLNKDGTYGKTIAIARSKERAGKIYTTKINGKDVSVAYDKDGFAKFDSKYDTAIDDSLLKNGSRKSHFKDANKNLAQNLKDDPSLANKMNLNDEQVKFFEERVSFDKSPPELTWHHHQDVGKMELVDRATHADPMFRHTGGFSIWGK